MYSGSLKSVQYTASKEQGDGTQTVINLKFYINCSFYMYHTL